MNLPALVERYRTAHKLAVKKVKCEKEALVSARQQVKDVEDGQRLVQEVAQSIQQRVHDRIATVVSRALTTVFDDPYEFRIHFEKKRGRTEARLSFCRDHEGKELDVSPADGVGGGVLDVASFALRLACLMLQKPRKARVLIMDEPFKFVSERRDYRIRVRQLLEELSKEMKIQFIFITHDPILQAGKIVELEPQ